MTSKYGFSVVAPIKVTSPSSTAGSMCVLLRLVEAVDLVEEEDRPLPVPAQAVAGVLDHAADVVDARRDGGQLLEGRAGGLRDDPGERGLADARRAVEDQRAQPVVLDRPAQGRAGAEHVLLADELVERARPKPLRERRVGGGTLARRVGEEVAHAAKYAPLVATHEAEDFSQPVLAGEGESDYERYLNTDALLKLQKTADEWVHRDELLFQTVHQSSELWLKLAWNDVEAATEHLNAGEIDAALRLLRRSVLCLQYATTQLDMLEQMSPWEYQEIRKVLGHGSGFDSPGWREIRRVTPALGVAFHALREQAGLSLADVYVRGREHEPLYQLAEALIEWDERINFWRIRHYKVVARVIGDSVVGTQGTPVEVLGRLIHHVFFPELWRVRNELTALSKEAD